MVSAQVADGVLVPGESAPSGAALARATGYSVLTCRRALRTLIKDGVLVPGASPSARPRVPGPVAAPGEQACADAARTLSATLAARRRKARLTQPELAAIVGFSLTSVGHAETGRVWQSRVFWERADKALSADGELLALHDAYRTGGIVPAPVATAESSEAETFTGVPETITVTVCGLVASVAIAWADGAVTTVYPPDSSRSSGGSRQ